MKFIIILFNLVIAHAGTIHEECNGVTISGVYYDRELLRQNLSHPYLLAVDYSTNNLYFSYAKNIEVLNSFQSARVNLDTKDFKIIEGVNNGFAQAVDQTNHEVYIGGSDGIYKYDIGTNTAHRIGAEGDSIWTLYYKDVLYYTTYPFQSLYTMIDGISTRFADLEDMRVETFVIDNDDVIFFTNGTGLFSQRRGTKDAIFYEDFSEVPVRTLTADKNGNVYVCLQDAVYAVNKEMTRIEKIIDIEEALGVTFDNDNNMIYADSSKIVRLKPNTEKNCSE